MLESLGYTEADERADADLILFNTCSIREAADSRFVAHLGEAKRLKREDPERVIGVGGCWAQSVKEEVFARFPFVDVAFGPGQVHKLAEFLTSDSLTAQGFFEFEGFTGHLPAKRAREFQGWVQISVGCNSRLLVLHRAVDPRPRGQPSGGELVAEVARARRRRRARGDAAGPERQLLRPRPAARSAGHVRAAAGRARRRRRDRPDPLHEPAPQGHARGRDPRARRAAGAVRAHPPAAAVGLEHGAQADAPHLHARALPRPGRADPRARPRLRADDRHHRRLSRARPRTTSSRRSRSRRRSATTARSRSSTRRGARPRPRRCPTRSRTSSRWSGWSGSSR